MKGLMIALVATLLATPVLAETHKVPQDNPLVTIVVPDKGWSVDKIARGIEVSDDDDEVYLAVEAVDNSNASDTVTAAISYLGRQGVIIDPSTKTEKQGRMGEFQLIDFGWKGKDHDGEVVVHITIAVVTEQRGIVFTYYASPKGDKEQDEALGKMLQSMKRVGG